MLSVYKVPCLLSSLRYTADIEQLTLFLFQHSTPLPVTIIPQCHSSIPTPNTEGLRRELIDWLADLAGDKVAAEWILLCASPERLLQDLTSSFLCDSGFNFRQSKAPPYFPTNYPFPDSSFLAIISRALALIFPLLATIPVSLHILNETCFYLV